MRDIAFLLILPVMIYLAAKRPFIALGMCVWSALVFPNGWMYGIGREFRLNLIFSLLMFASYAVYKNKKPFQWDVLVTLVLFFMFWTTLTTMFGVGNPDKTMEIWIRFSKIIILFVFVILVVESKLHFEFALWCVVFSVGFFALVESLKYLSTGGGHAIVGFDGHALGDRNELSVAFVMTIPICLYLRNEYGAKSWMIGFGLLGLVFLLVVGVLGTNSRGGLIALLFLAAYLFIKTKRKLLILVMTGMIVYTVLQILPESWFDRMNTIQNAEKDGSFMGRVVAWKMNFLMATERPLLGGGFKAVETNPVWQKLIPRFYDYSWFPTGDAVPNPEAARAAHSVYFQVMGDHGFAGLFIYLCMVAAFFLKARRIVKRVRKTKAPDWIRDAAVTLQLSMFAFCVGGAALSFAYFETIYVIFALTSVLDNYILSGYLAEKARAENKGPTVNTMPSLAR